MTSREFQEILDQLEQGMTPELTKIVDGQSYTRVFLPENRLILLGGGHIAVPLCAMASMLDFAVTVLDARISFANLRRNGFFSDSFSMLISFISRFLAFELVLISFVTFLYSFKNHFKR